GLDSSLLRAQSDAMGVPIIQRKTTWENYEAVFKEAVSELRKEGIEIGIFGDIDMQEHRDWVERVCKEVKIKPLLPLWKEDREKLLKEFIRTGFKAIVVATKADLLGKEWLGRQIDEEFIKDLKRLGNIDLCGEKGEYHTFVFDGPIFKRPVKFAVNRKIFRDRHWFLEVIPENEK
ncbi:MAG TPA: diphthine--ammonia ligase, partial [bacterium]|nr:diphthine--ammonia ligase [bacterium]